MLCPQLSALLFCLKAFRFSLLALAKTYFFDAYLVHTCTACTYTYTCTCTCTCIVLALRFLGVLQCTCMECPARPSLLMEYYRLYENLPTMYMYMYVRTMYLRAYNAIPLQERIQDIGRCFSSNHLWLCTYMYVHVHVHVHVWAHHVLTSIQCCSFLREGIYIVGRYFYLWPWTYIFLHCLLPW